LQLHESKEKTIADSVVHDRRSFLTNSVAAASTLAFVSVAFAEEDDEQDPVVTTPSISEGELTASSPPPFRVKEVVIPEKKKSADPRFFVAGGTSAAISHGITTPIDVVKTRMQSDSDLGKLSPTKAALKIVESEGPKALTAGLGPTVIGYGLEGALKFGVYESLKPICLLLIPGANSGEAYLAAAVCAGALASIVLCPMEETRIRLVTDPSFGKGLLDGLPKLIEEEGALAPFARGLPPMLSKQVPYTMGKQVSFDIFAAMLYSFLVGLSFVPRKEIALEVEIGAAFLASIVACLSSHPGDVLLTATYKDTSGSDKSDFISTIRKVYNDGGLSAFFRGLNARFVHVGCIITFQLVIYDQIKQGLGLPASGS
jgi:solute carrier family 25 phosphate transporter 3